jgi:uncharacterized SAM-binding protein YcdF (DUF218 family)
MDTENKNPLLAGLINVLIPGSSHLYINMDWGRFIRTFLTGVGILVAAIVGGNLIQNTKGYPLPQGICTGAALTVVVIVLFMGGLRTARERNSERNDADLYNAKRIVSHESDEIKHRKIQTMRDEGLISKQQYDDKNADVDAKSKK